jgi:tRNA (adenine57-N1/adenine58-N1)-methyltransferase
MGPSEKYNVTKNLNAEELDSCGQKFQAGDLVIFRDLKGKTYAQKLNNGTRFMTHLGVIEHADVIGKEDGQSIHTSIGKEVFVFRPTFNDFVKKMERKSAIIHPKDIGIILVWADIYPGLRVVEAGSGSGALLLALARTVGGQGEVISYDTREDLQEVGRKNILRFLGESNQVKFKIGNICEGIDERDVDRIILDIPTPWEAIETVKKSLRSGGIVLSYLPTIIQSEKLVKTLEADGNFFLHETMEFILRPWNIDGLSVRPQHRIIGHTGFITVARRIKK